MKEFFEGLLGVAASFCLGLMFLCGIGACIGITLAVAALIVKFIIS